jgi:hypothetical protein
MTPIQKALIRAGVKNLREFGYPGCTEENIITDTVFSQFFRSMLEQNRGMDRRADEAIEKLLLVLAGREPSGAK